MRALRKQPLLPRSISTVSGASGWLGGVAEPVRLWLGSPFRSFQAHLRTRVAQRASLAFARELRSCVRFSHCGPESAP
jgi:hypothetical protein